MLVVAPGRPAEQRFPVVRRAFVRVARTVRVVRVVPLGSVHVAFGRRPTLTPVVVLAVVVVDRRSRFDEPGVFVGGVIDDQIHDEFDVPVVEFLDQALPVSHIPELVHDRAVVGDVVAVIGVRRLVDRAQPHDVDAQFVEIVDLLDDSGDVADPVPIRIVETARVDLVGNGFLPPGAIRRVSPLAGSRPSLPVRSFGHYRN